MAGTADLEIDLKDALRSQGRLSSIGGKFAIDADDALISLLWTGEEVTRIFARNLSFAVSEVQAQIYEGPVVTDPTDPTVDGWREVFPFNLNRNEDIADETVRVYSSLTTEGVLNVTLDSADYGELVVSDDIVTNTSVMGRGSPSNTLVAPLDLKPETFYLLVLANQGATDGNIASTVLFGTIPNG